MKINSCNVNNLGNLFDGMSIYFYIIKDLFFNEINLLTENTLITKVITESEIN